MYNWENIKIIKNTKLYLKSFYKHFISQCTIFGKHLESQLSAMLQTSDSCLLKGETGNGQLGPLEGWGI